MSEYRRFVAYIYGYTNGRKEENAGFAKIESRNGVCRMQVSLLKLPREEKALNIYGFVREGGWLPGILIGQLSVQGTQGSARIQTSADDIGGSGYALAQLAGLWIDGAAGRKYLTVFDDEGIDPQKLVTELPRESVGKEESAAEDEGATEQAEDRGTLREAAGDGQPEISEDNEEKQETAKSEETEPAEDERPQPESQEEPSNPPIAENESREMTEDKDEKPEPPAQKLRAQEMSQCPFRPMGMAQRWQMLSRRCPHFQPFDDGEAVDCIQITLRELSYIWQCCQRSGNNSFLMHGFRSYRHLLFGKLDGGGYILGVPGVFENQEMFMANMFGFPDFKEAAPGNAPFRFGYWCRRIA